MLKELSGLQESEEDVWGVASLSFTIQTRSSEEEEVIEREYEFSYAREWDKWTFSAFKEKRAQVQEDSDMPDLGTWRVTEDLHWEDPDAVPEARSVPPEVQEELAEYLDADEFIIQPY